MLQSSETIHVITNKTLQDKLKLKLEEEQKSKIAQDYSVISNSKHMESVEANNTIDLVNEKLERGQQKDEEIAINYISPTLSVEKHNDVDSALSGFYAECLLKLSFSCVQRKMLVYIDRLDRLNKFDVLGDYLSIVRVAKNTRRPLMTEENLSESRMSGVDAMRNLDSLLDHSIKRFFYTHALRVKMPVWILVNVVGSPQILSENRAVKFTLSPIDIEEVESNHQLRMDVYTFPELADMVMCYEEPRENEVELSTCTNNSFKTEITLTTQCLLDFISAFQTMGLFVPDALWFPITLELRVLVLLLRKSTDPTPLNFGICVEVVVGRAEKCIAINMDVTLSTSYEQVFRSQKVCVESLETLPPAWQAGGLTTQPPQGIEVSNMAGALDAELIYLDYLENDIHEYINRGDDFCDLTDQKFRQSNTNTPLYAIVIQTRKEAEIKTERIERLLSSLNQTTETSENHNCQSSENRNSEPKILLTMCIKDVPGDLQQQQLQQFTRSPQKSVKHCARETGVTNFEDTKWKVYSPRLLHAKNE
ncbi:hypothetical protein ANN_09380 [Periplaneta americana]|uniref:Uncharacterized protein n=1 Tax=Periplaneta americana TaxID=6978 RepID=A0ABQ8TLI1_PERAM|nr:hypothetical protein ANN_09380 [Periplaneta americana]